MKSSLLKPAIVLLSLCAIGIAGCSKKQETEESDPKPKVAASETPEDAIPGAPATIEKLPPVVETHDKISEEISTFRNQTRALYNNRKFDELEALAAKLRTEKARFGNGSWMIYVFYECQNCQGSEPESMWQLHEKIHNEWIAAKPQSITARVSYANFLVKYAWHARGSGYADSVTKPGWRMFEDRLEGALKVLDDAASLQEKCPVWARVRMTVALGQGWQPAEFERLFAAAKAAEPEFWSYDVARAYYLLPRWHGEEGDWEAAADDEAKRPGSMGMEGYARVVIGQSDFYRNVFSETKVSWPDTRKGLEILREKYPDSLQILSAYCMLACQKCDRALARQLFDEIGGRMEVDVWEKKSYFIKCRNWAYGR